MSIMLFFSSLMALWVYVVPLMGHAGVTSEAGGNAISFALAAQLAAGLAGGILARMATFSFALLIASLALAHRAQGCGHMASGIADA